MAVDYRGQPITNQTAFTTTGIMNRKPAAVKPPKLGNIKQPQPKIEEKELAEERIPQINLENLRDTDKQVLNMHLTPSLKNVFSRIFGQDIFGKWRIYLVHICPPSLRSIKLDSGRHNKQNTTILAPINRLGIY